LNIQDVAQELKSQIDLLLSCNGVLEQDWRWLLSKLEMGPKLWLVQKHVLHVIFSCQIQKENF
jgi:hypothetical protein